MPVSKSLYRVHNRAKGTPAGQGPAIPSDRSPSRRQRARPSVVYWSPGPSRALTPFVQRLPRTGSPCWTPQQLTPDRRDVNRAWSAASRAAHPAPSRPSRQPGRPWSQLSQSGTIKPPSACEGGHDTPGVTQRSRGRAGPARIAVTMVMAGSAVPRQENSLAARMTWPHRLASLFPLAPRRDRLPGPCELSGPGPFHCHQSSSSRRSSK